MKLHENYVYLISLGTHYLHVIFSIVINKGWVHSTVIKENVASNGLRFSHRVSTFRQNA